MVVLTSCVGRGPAARRRPRIGLGQKAPRARTRKRPLVRRRSRRDRKTAVVALLLTVATVAVLVWPARAEWQRRAAWKRIGSCDAVGSSPRVNCSGVTLVQLRLPDSFAACQEIRSQNDGVCSVPVNREVLERFQGAVADIDRAGLGRTVTAFGTVNRRRCKDARTGAFIAGCISKHSYGLAADVRAFGDNARWDEVIAADPGVQQMIDVFRSHGFRWGMSFRSNPDPQHVEWTP